MLKQPRRPAHVPAPPSASSSSPASVNFFATGAKQGHRDNHSLQREKGRTRIADPAINGRTVFMRADANKSHGHGRTFLNDGCAMQTGPPGDARTMSIPISCGPDKQAGKTKHGIEKKVI